MIKRVFVGEAIVVENLRVGNIANVENRLQQIQAALTALEARVSALE